MSRRSWELIARKAIKRQGLQCDLGNSATIQDGKRRRFFLHRHKTKAIKLITLYLCETGLYLCLILIKDDLPCSCQIRQIGENNIFTWDVLHLIILKFSTGKYTPRQLQISCYLMSHLFLCKLYILQQILYITTHTNTENGIATPNRERHPSVKFKTDVCIRMYLCYDKAMNY